MHHPEAISASLILKADGDRVIFLEANTIAVPSITLTEVFKCIMRQRGEDVALEAVAHMEQGKVISLDGVLSIDAAVYGLKHKLPLADSIVYAAAKKFSAVIWTQDADFKALPDVKYFQKVKAI